MNLHIMHNDKFIAPYISFIETNFKIEDHFFVLYKGVPEEIIPVEYIDRMYKLENNKSLKENLKVLRLMFKANRIYLHGLFIREVIILLFLNPWLLKKCRWMIWGGDLYNFKEQDNIKGKIFAKMRAYIIRNFEGYITQITGDYEIVRDIYKGKGSRYYSFLYLSNVFYPRLVSKTSSGQDKKIKIQVGNSADPSNNHLEVFNKLLKYKDYNIEIICPLSYGNKDYAKNIIEVGYEMFSSKFSPIEEFMSLEKYNKILEQIDIAIFNHKRQQACGNITSLIGLGKKVYIRKEISTWNFAVEHDLVVYDTNNIENANLLEEIPNNIRENNRTNVINKFSEEKLYKDWENIFKI